MPTVRRLAAILAADVAGYSRLMGADEEGTHERLKAHLRGLIEPKIKEHRGHTVKNTGDGLLAEFPSVVDAVRCAVEVQRGVAERNAETPEDKRLTFRIGVNLGDVIVEEHDIFGDGVNVAARLEGLAEPGGVCISRVVRDQIRDKLPYPFEDRGEQSVKNIVRSVQVYTLRPEAVAELPMSGTPIAVPRRRGNSVWAIAAVATPLVLAITWWLWPITTPTPTPMPAGATTGPIVHPFVAPRLSIVVLPFANLSNAPDQQYFADGITEDLTTNLSRIAHSFVISRNTAFTYRNKPVDTKQIGHELGVRYVLEGSVQRSGNRVRVTAQLIDAETDAHLWAERFDRDMGDMFALQNEITSLIAGTLNLELIRAEETRPSEHPDALDYILRGRAFYLNPPTRESFAKAISLFEHALALDPHSAEAQALLATVLVNRIQNGMTESAAADLARAEGLVDQALAVSPRSAWAHYAKGGVLRGRKRCEDAIPEYETALTLNRNFVAALNGLGWCKLFTGSIEEVIPLEEKAIRLSPRDPNIGYRYLLIGTVHLLQSRTDEAIAWLEKGRSAMPAAPGFRDRLAAAYALRGETERAAAELAEARRLRGDGSFSSIARLRRIYWGVPAVRELYEATYFAGLRKAGVPEE
jgi:adenylate cyclase